MVPKNLFRMAASVTGTSTVWWYRAIGRTLPANGVWQTTLAAPIPIKGSFQVVSHSLKMQLGLDFKTEVYQFYTDTNMQDLERDTSGDQLEFAGTRFQILANENWINIAGWNGTICARITP
jgi:E217 collar protein gp28